jgi:hypothetical protein
MAFDPVWFNKGSNFCFSESVEKSASTVCRKTTQISAGIFESKVFPKIPPFIQLNLQSRVFIQTLASFGLDPVVKFYESLGLNPKLLIEDGFIVMQRIEQFKKEHSLLKMDEVLLKSAMISNHAVYTMARACLFENLEQKANESLESFDLRCAIFEKIVSPEEKEIYQNISKQNALEKRAFILAAENGNLLLFRALVGKFPLSKIDFESIAQNCVKKGYFEILDTLTRGSSEFKVIAIKEAAKIGKLRIVSNLLKFHQLTPGDASSIIEIAIHNGFKNVVSYLINQCELDYLKEGILEEVTKKGWSDIFIMMIQSFDFQQDLDIERDVRVRCLEIAIKSGYVEIVRVIARIFPAKAYHVNDFARKAIQNGHYEVLNELFENWIVTNKYELMKEYSNREDINFAIRRLLIRHTNCCCVVM